MSSPIAIPSRSRAAVAGASSSYSERSSTSSPSSSWTPSGVYIPVHKRHSANSSVSSLSSVGSSSCTSNPLSCYLRTISSHMSPTASDSTTRIYSRDALLSLARSPLTSREAPQLAPTLLSSCPEIVDGGASGIARALAMGRTPVWHGNNSRGRRGVKKTDGKRAKRNQSLSSESSDHSDHSRRTD